MSVDSEDSMVAMPDGVGLYTRIWKPDDGIYPVVLQRGYAPGSERDAVAFVQGGYVFVGQSCRGHGNSEGEMNRFFDDAQDGYDAMTWIAEQPWCDGNVVMYGRSYYAQTQWLAATTQHPNLKAIIPQHMNADMWECAYWCHGALNLAMTAGGRMEPELHTWEEILGHLPLIDMDRFAQGEDSKLWQDYIRHSTCDEFWQAISVRDYSAIRIPVYLMSGWYDYYAGAAGRAFNALKEVGATDEIRMMINPSNHTNQIVGDRDFGADVHKDELGEAMRWLDFVIKGIDTGIENEPPIRLFVMGENEWRFENKWPVSGTQFTNYYFHSLRGERVGTLDVEPAGDEIPIPYTYDPKNPVPSLGGNHSADARRNLDHLVRNGPVDQRPNEDREDVLVFSTLVLEENVDVIGPVEVVLYASSSAVDTDFVARLIDVAPDGTAFNLTEGILRARFRKSLYEPPELMTPGEVYAFTIALYPTANVFLKGHRIRVHITSSGFPLWDRNPNTGHEQGVDAEIQVAKQTVFHNASYPSHIVLPIVPLREVY